MSGQTTDPARSPTTLGAAVIGLGKLGLLHAGIANALPGVRLVGVAERDAKVARMFGTVAPHVPVVDEEEKLLDQGDVDLVLIATPTGSHVESALQCVRRGLPFFVEKPLSATADHGLPPLSGPALKLEFGAG